MSQDRRTTLDSLIQLSVPLAAIQSELRKFPWDSEEEFVVLTAADIANVLQRYLDGSVSADTVRDWAETIEGRDDIAFEASQRDTILQSIHELANPLLYEGLNETRARQLVQALAELKSGTKE